MVRSNRIFFCKVNMIQACQPPPPHQELYDAYSWRHEENPMCESKGCMDQAWRLEGILTVQRLKTFAPVLVHTIHVPSMVSMQDSSASWLALAALGWWTINWHYCSNICLESALGALYLRRLQVIGKIGRKCMGKLAPTVWYWETPLLSVRDFKHAPSMYCPTLFDIPIELTKTVNIFLVNRQAWHYHTLCLIDSVIDEGYQQEHSSE